MGITKQRLVMTLAQAHIPIDTVRISAEVLNGQPALVERTYMPWATLDEIAAGDAIIAGFDWSPEADAEWVQAQTREQAKSAITGTTPELLATRAACVALMLSLQECRAKVNELIAATGANATPLVTGESVADAFGTVAQLIDAGAV